MKKMIIAVLLLVMSASVCSAETAKDAVRALKKLEARCQAGISYRDFAPAIGDAKLYVNLYTESEEAKKNPKLVLAITEAMANYQFANSIWSRKFSDGTIKDFIRSDEPEFDIFFEAYPDVKKVDTPESVVSETNGTMRLHISSAVKHCFSAASKELDKAAKLLSPQPAPK